MSENFWGCWRPAPLGWGRGCPSETRSFPYVLSYQIWSLWVEPFGGG